MAGRFEGKQALVLGVANQRSIAWAIAKRLADEGATVAFTYQGERIEKNVRDLAATIESPLVTECDVRSDDDVARVFSEVSDAFGGGLDVLVHSVAFAAAEDLEGRFVDTPRDRFWMAVDISAYSLVACSRAAEPLMESRGGGSIVTMTYLGGERAVPHYNVMGVAKATLDASVKYLAWDLGYKNIRVNAISAGPVRTLAARSIAGFTTMQTMFEERAPLHRQIESEDCGGAAAYLLSDDAANVSGTTLYVDAGYHAMGDVAVSIEQRVAELGLELPPVRPPAASFVNAVRTGNLVYLSGAGPVGADGQLPTGKVGADVTTEEAAEHARVIALNLLAVLRHEVGSLDRVTRVVKLLGMVNATPDFVEHSRVINGCSDLFVEVFGEGHARSAVGVGSLPFGMPVEIEAIFEVE